MKGPLLHIQCVKSEGLRDFISHLMELLWAKPNRLDSAILLKSSQINWWKVARLHVATLTFKLPLESRHLFAIIRTNDFLEFPISDRLYTNRIAKAWSCFHNLHFHVEIGTGRFLRHHRSW